MPPGPGHYRPNLSNQFNQYQQAHTATNFQHQQNNNFPGHNLRHHPAFPTSHQNGHVNLFGSGLANGGLANNFSAGAAGSLGNAGASGFASQETQMTFAHGAGLQHQQAVQLPDVGAQLARGTGATRIREVWKTNLAQEMAMIRGLIEKYPYVSMDTEFPGVVARPMGNFPSKADYHYQCLRCNVDLLKLIQLGLTLFSADGELPPANPETSVNSRSYVNSLIPCPCAWTFNFAFNLDQDMYSEDSIAMLKKAGVDFEKNAEMGIDPTEFGSLLTTSGLVLDDRVSWLSFHSGYDFGYLVKIMNQISLPNDEEEYLDIVRTWFPRIYDIKYLFRHAQRLTHKAPCPLSQQAIAIINSLGQKSGLQDLADELGCQREGRPHTAGSDAWLTGQVFWQLRQKVFDGNVPDEHVGMIWGLTGVGPPASAASQAHAATAIQQQQVQQGQQTPHTNGATLFQVNTGMTPQTHKSDVTTASAGSQQHTNPSVSTPQSSHAAMTASTPGYGPGAMAPGLGAGSIFGAGGTNFQYGAR